jgi:tRNA(Ile)-lysidine synthase
VSRVVEAIRGFAAGQGLAGPGVVAVSGGADSVALFRGLLEAGFGALTVAHFNHRLRGDASDADETFVHDLATRLGLPVRSTRADVATAAVGDNLEATARRLRYGWLADVARAVNARWVATGHTADDQAETILHRLIRGTGLQGLRGIAVERELAREIRLARPLLTATRADVLAYLDELDQPYREDASNRDLRFTRNRIRHELVPLLRTFNPEIVAVLGRLAVQAAERFDEASSTAADLLRTAEHPRAGDRIILDATLLAESDVRQVRDLFRLLWDREGWPRDAMTFAHWDRLAAIAGGLVPAADFPGGIHVRRTGRVVQLTRRG